MTKEEKKLTKQKYWEEHLKWTKLQTITFILLTFLASMLGILNYSKQYTDFSSFVGMLTVLVVWGIFGWYLYHITKTEK